jgi:hypothetical protein
VTLQSVPACRMSIWSEPSCLPWPWGGDSWWVLAHSLQHKCQGHKILAIVGTVGECVTWEPSVPSAPSPVNLKYPKIVCECSLRSRTNKISSVNKDETHYFTRERSLSLSLSLIHTHTLPPLSLTHTHTHTHTHMVSHTRTHSPSRSLSLCLSHAHSLSLQEGR